MPSQPLPLPPPLPVLPSLFYCVLFCFRHPCSLLPSLRSSSSGSGCAGSTLLLDLLRLRFTVGSYISTTISAGRPLISSPSTSAGFPPYPPYSPVLARLTLAGGYSPVAGLTARLPSVSPPPPSGAARVVGGSIGPLPFRLNVPLPTLLSRSPTPSSCQRLASLPPSLRGATRCSSLPLPHPQPLVVLLCGIIGGSTPPPPSLRLVAVASPECRRRHASFSPSPVYPADALAAPVFFLRLSRNPPSHLVAVPTARLPAGSVLPFPLLGSW